MQTKLKKISFTLFLAITVFGAGCASQNKLKNRAGITIDKSIKADGIFIHEVQNGGPIERAGIRDGDIIISYDGKEITDLEVMEKEIKNSEPGKKVVLEVMRGNSIFNVGLAFKQKGLKIVNAQPNKDFPNYAINLVDNLIWIGTFPYPVEINKFENILPPHDFYDPDHIPANPPILFSITIR